MEQGGGRHPFGVALFIAHFNVFFYFPHFNGVAPIIAHSQRERGRNYTVNATVSLRSSTNTPNRWMLLHMDERFPTRRHRADCPLLQSFDIIVLALHRKFTCVAAYFFVRQDSRTSVADYASLRLCRPTASIRLCTACPPNRMSISLRFSSFQLIVHAELRLAYLHH